MKLVSFEVHCRTGPQTRLGVLEGTTVVDVAAAHEELLERGPTSAADAVASARLPTSMLSFLQAGERALEAADTVVSTVRSGALSERENGPRLTYERSEVRLLSPLPRPNSIRDCSVYEEHLLNCRGIEPGSLPDAYYEYPVYYKGNPDAVVHPGERVTWPRYTEKLDFELEIAAVVGARGRDVDPDSAEEYIAGFTIFNDFSARDVQAEAKPVKMGPSKSKDFANGFGPCLVTAGSIDPTDLQTEVRVNGEPWSENTTDGMTHSWGRILEHVSEGITIHPGDVIGSGTVPRGCSLELDRWLDPGDTLELEVAGIGTLEHEIVDAT